jgi:hypothetical protein
MMENSFWAELNSSKPLSIAEKGLTASHESSINLRSGHSQRDLSNNNREKPAHN